jgi:hypothetical protein
MIALLFIAMGTFIWSAIDVCKYGLRLRACMHVCVCVCVCEHMTKFEAQKTQT